MAEPTVAEAIRAAAAMLEQTSDTARLDAEILMAHALGGSRSDMLIKCMRDAVPPGYGALVSRRAAHEPVAYITGEQEFYGLAFAVTPDVLIPRGDSEVLIEAALDLCPEPQRVLDLGTGSGALLLTLLHRHRSAEGVGVDASAAALDVARRNLRALGEDLDCRFLQRDWRQPGWTEDLGRFDLIVCNPPYVEDDAPLDPDVRDFEPASALFAGPEGLADYRVLFPRLRALMAEGAVAIFEIGHEQAQSVSAIARANGFAVELRRDLADRPRALILT